MGEPEVTRLAAWNIQMRAVHDRLRAALTVVRESLDAGELADPGRDLELYCGGFCTAVHGHHRGEDHTLFPALAAAHPELGPVLVQLRQDHAMLDHLVAGLRAAVDARADRAEITRHLDGIGALLESHFRFEERRLLAVLETLDLVATPGEVFGPLAD